MKTYLKNILWSLGIILAPTQSTLYLAAYLAAYSTTYSPPSSAQIINTPEGKVNCDEPHDSVWCGGRMSQGLVTTTTESLQKQCMIRLLKEKEILVQHKNYAGNKRNLIIEPSQKQSVALDQKHFDIKNKTNEFNIQVTSDSPLQAWLSNTPCDFLPVTPNSCFALSNTEGVNLNFAINNKTPNPIQTKMVCLLKSVNEHQDIYIHFQNNQQKSTHVQWAYQKQKG